VPNGVSWGPVKRGWWGCDQPRCASNMQFSITLEIFQRYALSLMWTELYLDKKIGAMAANPLKWVYEYSFILLGAGGVGKTSLLESVSLQFPHWSSWNKGSSDGYSSFQAATSTIRPGHYVIGSSV
jgi:hypothetical protein